MTLEDLEKILRQYPTRPESEAERWFAFDRECTSEMKNARLLEDPSIKKPTPRCRLRDPSSCEVCSEAAWNEIQNHVKFDVAVPRAVYPSEAGGYIVDRQPLRISVQLAHPSISNQPQSVVCLRQDLVIDTLKGVLKEPKDIDTLPHALVQLQGDTEWSSSIPVTPNLRIHECCLVDDATLLFDFKTPAKRSSTNTGMGGSCKRDASPQDIRVVPTGLTNIGNTCFMNSALQCLAHTTALVSHFEDKHDIRDLNTKNPIGYGGQLARAFRVFLQDMDGKSFAPRDVKKVVSKHASQFAGYAQQDAQEFLAFLLDGLHEDMNRIHNKPITPVLEVDDEKDCPQIGTDCWVRHKSRNDSIIVDTCQGQYRSRLQCPQCNHVSIVYDPFMFLSVPLPQTQYQHFVVVLSIGPRVVLPISIDVPKRSRGSEVKQKVLENLKSKKKTHAYLEREGLSVEDLETSDIHLYMKGADLWNIADHQLVTDARLGGHEKKIFALVKKDLNIGGGDKLILHVPSPTSDNPTFVFALSTNGPVMEDFVKDLLSYMVGEPQEITYSNSPSLYTMDTIPIEFEMDEKINSILGVSEVVVIKSIPKASRTVFLPAPRGPSHGRSVTLAQCLEEFSITETLTQENSWRCPKCKEDVMAEKGMKLDRLPQVLIIHLKRFSQRHIWRTEKNDTFVDFPISTLLDMSPYMVPGRQGGEYKLFGISHHFGSMGGGHYTASATYDGTWYYFDDTWVHTKSVEADPSAYILFYAKC